MAAPTLSGARIFSPARVLSVVRTGFAAVWDNLGMAIRSNLLTFVSVCILAFVGFVAAIIWSPPRPPLALASGTILAPARPLADFSLIDNQGRSFGAANLRGHWSLTFFGYTDCPDYCPTTLTTLAALEKQLRADKALAPLRVIFVSVDAKRDTPAQLEKYVPYFDPEFVGLTAPDQSTIESTVKKWNVFVA